MDNRPFTQTKARTFFFKQARSISRVFVMLLLYTRHLPAYLCVSVVLLSMTITDFRPIDVQVCTVVLIVTESSIFIVSTNWWCIKVWAFVLRFNDKSSLTLVLYSRTISYLLTRLRAGEGGGGENHPPLGFFKKPRKRRKIWTQKKYQFTKFISRD